MWQRRRTWQVKEAGEFEFALTGFEPTIRPNKSVVNQTGFTARFNYYSGFEAYVSPSAPAAPAASAAPAAPSAPSGAGCKTHLKSRTLAPF